jgi:hypothetical protein
VSDDEQPAEPPEECPPPLFGWRRERRRFDDTRVTRRFSSGRLRRD